MAATSARAHADGKQHAVSKPINSSATKRKASDEEDMKKTKPSAYRSKKSEPTIPTSSRPIKKAKSTTTAAALAKPSSSKPTAPNTTAGPDRKRPNLRRAKTVNEPPRDILKVFVFGEGSAGELGLGPSGRVRDIKYPHLNTKLSPESTKIVQLATGGMHCVALAADGVIYTWGVNDHGTLGRDTKGGDVYTEMKNGGSNEKNDASDDDSDSDALNIFESTPYPVSLENVPKGTVFASVATSDSCTFALTDNGKVYGCGTFRNNEGILGFSRSVRIQETLTPIPELSKIKQIVCGADHVIAMDESGTIFSWGAGQQNQLGRRFMERYQTSGLRPNRLGTPKGRFVTIGAGSYSSFAIDKANKVWAWGLNSFGELGIPDNVEDEDSDACLLPTVIPVLSDRGVIQISGGAHHTLAVCDDGSLLGVGRLDGFQLGDDGSSFFDANMIKDLRGKNRILKVPTQIPNLPKNAAFASAGADHSLAVMKNGEAYSWGFSTNYQTGQGTEDDVERPTLMNNKAIRNEKVVWCGAGGQYGVLAAKYEP